MSFPTSSLVLAPIAAVIVTVAGSSGAPPDLTGIAAIVTAAVGVIAFLGTLFRGYKNNQRVREVEQAASYVKGFDALIKRLQNEIEELSSDHEQDRKKWEAEREVLLRTISELRNENYETRGQLAELRGQIKGFLSAQQWEEFQQQGRLP